MWSLAVPLFAAPDEPSHVVRAAAVARGQLAGPEHVPPERPAVTDVVLPEVFASSHRVPKCLLGHPEQSAACSPPLARSHRPVVTGTFMGRYPPAYYFVVGLPSRWAVSPFGVRLMRLASAALTAALLASAVATARSARSPGLRVGVALAATPMVLFLGGSVNPNGVEAAAAVGLWVSVVALRRRGTGVEVPAVARRAAVAAAVLANARPLGPAWVAAVLAVAGVAAGWPRVAALWRVAEVRRAAACTAVATAVAVAWNVLEHSYDGFGDPRGPRLPLVEFAAGSLGRTWDRLLQMVGVFGWTDTRGPLLTYAVWLGGVAAVAALALRSPDRRATRALGVLAAVVVAVPVAGEMSKHIGFYWLGRYTLPLAVGVPVLAADAAGPALARHRAAVRQLSVLLPVAHLLALAWTLHRFAEGVDGTAPVRWSPPVPAPLLLAAFAGAAALCWSHLAVGPGRRSVVLDLRPVGGGQAPAGQVGAGLGQGHHAPAEAGPGEPGAVDARGGHQALDEGVEGGRRDVEVVPEAGVALGHQPPGA